MAYLAWGSTSLAKTFGDLEALDLSAFHLLKHRMAAENKAVIPPISIILCFCLRSFFFFCCSTCLLQNQ